MSKAYVGRRVETGAPVGWSGGVGGDSIKTTLDSRCGQRTCVCMCKSVHACCANARGLRARHLSETATAGVSGGRCGTATLRKLILSQSAAISDLVPASTPRSGGGIRDMQHRMTLNRMMTGMRTCKACVLGMHTCVAVRAGHAHVRSGACNTCDVQAPRQDPVFLCRAMLRRG
jgi:hypothetical protein